MDTKIIKKYIDKKIKNKNEYSLKNIYVLLILIELSFNNIIDKKQIKQYLINLNNINSFSINWNNEESIVNNLELFLEQMKSKKIAKKFLHHYIQAVLAIKKCNKLDYDFNSDQHPEKVIEENNLYMHFFKTLEKLNAFIYEELSFNYSPIIEYARDSIIGEMNEK